MIFAVQPRSSGFAIGSGSGISDVCHSLVNYVELGLLLAGWVPAPHEKDSANQRENCGGYRDVKTDDPKFGDIATQERHSILQGHSPKRALCNVLQV